MYGNLMLYSVKYHIITLYYVFMLYYFTMLSWARTQTSPSDHQSCLSLSWPTFFPR